MIPEKQQQFERGPETPPTVTGGAEVIRSESGMLVGLISPDAGVGMKQKQAVRNTARILSIHDVNDLESVQKSQTPANGIVRTS